MKKCRYPLHLIKAQMQTTQDMNLTSTAKMDISALGMSEADALDVIKALTPGEMHKSMPTHKDPSVWQDVYYTEWQEIVLYVKFQKAQQYVVISFKEA